MKPYELGLRHWEWREGQEEAVEAIARSTKNVVILQAPTGSGKSTIILALLRALSARGFILTPNLTLQDQYLYEANGKAVKTLGRNNYHCPLPGLNPEEASERGVDSTTTVDDAPCSSGFKCPFKIGCPWFSNRKRALLAPITVHSNAYWLRESTYVGGFTGGDWVVADEGHLLDNLLTSFLTVEISSDTLKVLRELGFRIHLLEDDPYYWRKLGERAVEKAREWMEEAGEGTVERSKRQRWMRIFEGFSGIKGDWVVERSKEVEGVRVSPIWSPPALDHLLTGKAERLLIVSATILDPILFTRYLSIPPNSYEYIELPSTFPPTIRPIYFRPTASMSYDTRWAAAPALAGAVDAILDGRRGERGIIHTHSYALLEAVLPRIKNQSRLIVHSRGRSRMEAITTFRRARGDYWLISPSMGYGEDFPYDSARSQIILKMPFPDMNSKVVKARMRADRNWYRYTTTQEVMQLIGRVVRSKSDYGETWILDSKFEGLISGLPASMKTAIQ